MLVQFEKPFFKPQIKSWQKRGGVVYRICFVKNSRFYRFTDLVFVLLLQNVYFVSVKMLKFSIWKNQRPFAIRLHNFRHGHMERCFQNCMHARPIFPLNSTIKISERSYLPKRTYHCIGTGAIVQRIDCISHIQLLWWPQKLLSSIDSYEINRSHLFRPFRLLFYLHLQKEGKARTVWICLVIHGTVVPNKTTIVICASTLHITLHYIRVRTLHLFVSFRFNSCSVLQFTSCVCFCRCIRFFDHLSLRFYIPTGSFVWSWLRFSVRSPSVVPP